MTTNIGRLLALLGAVLLTFGLVGSVAAHHLGGAHPTESAEVDVAYGEFGHVTTDSELGDRPEGGDGATPGDPLETLASNLAPGHTRVDEGPITGTAPSGYTYFGQEVHITSPARTPELAVVIQFLIDSSLLAGVDRNGVQAFRDGVLVGTCTRDEGLYADPDPCLKTRTQQYGDDLVLTLYSSQPSAAWNIGRVPALASTAPAGGNTAPAGGNTAPALPNTAADPRNAVPVLPGHGVVAVLFATALAARPVLRSGARPASPVPALVTRALGSNRHVATVRSFTPIRRSGSRLTKAVPYTSPAGDFAASTASFAARSPSRKVSPFWRLQSSG